jgi:hypothetical protein
MKSRHPDHRRAAQRVEREPARPPAAAALLR